MAIGKSILAILLHVHDDFLLVETSICLLHHDIKMLLLSEAEKAWYFESVPQI